MATFLRLSEEMETALLAYLEAPSFSGVAEITLLSDQMVALFDLNAVPLPERREAGVRSFTYLMEIFARIGAPDLTTFPDTAGAEALEDSAFRIPGTPIRIMHMDAGDRTGEFLFSANTEQAAFRFFRAIRHLPLQSALDIESFTEFGPQLTGPLVPPGVVAALPEFLRVLWLDTPAWKVLLIAIIAATLLAVAMLLQRFLAGRAPASRLTDLLLRMLVPLAVLVATLAIMPFASHQVNVSGRFARIVHSSELALNHLAYAWLFWLSARVLFEWIIRSPRILDESLDANLLRLLAGVIGIVGGVVILAFGGQAIGLPIMSVLAGLGIGGLAVALALRPTLENLVGGVILYIDRPVRVGDFCSFGDMTGTVEGIGIRSTKLRALNRTLISVPNAQFAT
jgi:MscS family membrane protein